jgi:hypothetical protein
MIKLKKAIQTNHKRERIIIINMWKCFNKVRKIILNKKNKLKGVQKIQFLVQSNLISRNKLLNSLL